MTGFRNKTEAASEMNKSFEKAPSSHLVEAKLIFGGIQET